MVVTTPKLPALPLQDLNDAIEYAGLKSWLVDISIWPGILSESRAAAAANGIGLCENFSNYRACEAEGRKRALENVYSIT